jgi:Fe-S oxidoreductase
VTAVATEEARVAVAAVAERCRPCIQCGQCRGACPQGLDMAEGPRRVVRQLLAGDVGGLLESEDVWRCSGCGSCTTACPMEVDVAAVMAEVRSLQQAFGGPRCPERGAAGIAARRLAKKSTVDAVAFGVAMAVRGFVPGDLVEAASQGTRRVARRLQRSPRPAPPRGEAALFYAGCSLEQDPALHRGTLSLAAELGVELGEPAGAGCCGHPAGAAPPACLAAAGSVVTACPACDRSLADAGISTKPLWEVLVGEARRDGRRLTGRAARFVPYIGCLADRDGALALLAEAAELAGAECVTTYRSLHAGCCGALGGVYRGPSEEVLRLLEFAAAEGAPIVTPCLLCRDNVRGAARRRHPRVEAYFWPEFFRAAPRSNGQGGTDA